MKFIRTLKDTVYVNVEKATAFAVRRRPSLVGENQGFDACLFINDFSYQLKFFETEAEAQAWLDDFVAKLNAEAVK